MSAYKNIKIVNTETIAYIELGDSTSDNVLVCLHGNFGSSQQFYNFSRGIPNNIRIILPDLRGFGHSSYNTPVNNFSEHADDIICLINKLNIEKFSLLGFYIGGAVAMEMASSLKDRVEKLILVSSVGTMGYPMAKLNSQGAVLENEFLKTREEIDKDTFRLLPLKQVILNRDVNFASGILESIYFTQKTPNDKIVETLISDIFNQKNITDTYMCLNNFNISNKNNGVVDGNNKIAEITAETIVVQGSNDAIVPFDMAYTIKYSLLSKSKIVTGTFGHSPFNDVPEWINEVIFNFLEL